MPRTGALRIVAGMQALRAHLAGAFTPSAANDMDFSIAIESPGERLSCVVADNRLAFDRRGTNDFTIYVPSEAHALALFRGEVPPMDAFMQGELRASGYIVDVFRFLGCFLPR